MEPLVFLQNLQLGLYLQLLVINALKMLIVLQMELFAVGLKPLKNVFLPVPLPQQPQQQHHQNQLTVPHSLLVYARLIPNVDGALIQPLTPQEPLLLQLLSVAAW